MNELKIFEHPDFGKIRTVTIDDEPYLVGKDVAEVLGYSNTKRGRSGTEKEDTMTYGDMTVRQFLNGVREAKTEVLNLQRKLLELKTASENVTAHWKDVPGGGGSADPHKDEIVNALCDLSTMYGEKVLAYLRYMEETEAFIDTVSGFENRLILQLRYVDCMKWDTIEATMRRMGIYYSTRHITRLHGYALLAAERAWAVWKETERHEDRNSQQEDQ